MSKYDNDIGKLPDASSSRNRFGLGPDMGKKRAESISDCVKKINEMKQNQNQNNK